MGHRTTALSVVCGTLLTKEEKRKIKMFLDCGLTERQIALKIDKFKIVAYNFLYDPVNYFRNNKSE